MSKQLLDDSGIELFTARVRKTYISSDDFSKLEKDNDYVKIYNGNEQFDSKDVRFLGAIEFDREDGYALENYAFPFDKNNLTYPISGETVNIIRYNNEYFYLPYTVTQYPNFREDYKTTLFSQEKEIKKEGNKQNDYKEVNSTGTTNSSAGNNKEKYKVNEKIKFLKPKVGDTVITGRVGNTIRFSEFFLTDDKESSPGIFIRNFQNKELDSNPIGKLVEEDINKDGSSIYIVSNKIKVPFKETIKKSKVAFKEYPSSDKLTGNQIYINSDLIMLSAKTNEFIIYGKKNTGIITDANFSVDAAKSVNIHSEEDALYQCEKNITIHSKKNNKIFLNSENGEIYLGKDKGAGDAGASVQKMVLGGELVKFLEDLLDILSNQVFLTPSGPTPPGPQPGDKAKLVQLKAKVKTLLAAKNFLSKS